MLVVIFTTIVLVAARHSLVHHVCGSKAPSQDQEGWLKKEQGKKIMYQCKPNVNFGSRFWCSYEYLSLCKLIWHSHPRFPAWELTTGKIIGNYWYNPNYITAAKCRYMGARLLWLLPHKHSFRILYQHIILRHKKPLCPTGNVRKSNLYIGFVSGWEPLTFLC